VRETRRLTEGAILLAIYTVLLLMFLYLPIIGVFLSFILPIPFIYYSARQKIKNSIVFLIGGLIISFIVGNVFSIPITLAYGTTGIVIGWFIKEKKDRILQYINATLVFLINLVIIYAVSILFLDVNILDELLVSFKESIQTTIRLLETMGQTVDENMTETFNQLIETIEILLPTLLVMSSAIVVLLMMVICLPIVRKLGIEVPKAPPFRELTMPKSLLWYYLIVLLLMLVVNPDKGTYMYTAIFNLVYILQTLMLIQGISFIFYYSYVKGFPKAIPIIGIIFSFLIPILSSFVRILGIIDLGFNLRQRISK